MIGILGSGFGLYGYLPALCLYYPNKKILLNSGSRLKFNARTELREYSSQIIWVDGIEQIINRSELLIICYPPFEVEKLIDILIKSSVLKKIIVEKPVCETSEKSRNFIEKIELAGKKIISSYIFIYTDWFKNISINLSTKHKIDWQLLNVNPKESWKWNEQQGGGLLNFYGIHLVAICAYFDLKCVEITHNSFEKLECVFRNNFNEFIFTINYTKDETFFKVDDNYIGPTPFGVQSKPEKKDFRIEFLLCLIDNFEKNYLELNQLLKKTISLWNQIECQLKY